MAEPARASPGFAARPACARAARPAAALTALFAAFICAGVARAQPRVEIVVTPAGEQAARLGQRVLELLAGAGVRPELFHTPRDAPASAAGDTLAFVAIDLADDTHVRVHIRAADGAALTRELPRAQPVLDEAAREEVAAVVASSIDALLAGKPLAAAEPSAPPSTAPASDDVPASQPAAEAPRSEQLPATAPAPAVPAAEPPPPRPAAASNAEPLEGERAPALVGDADYRAALGYEIGLWGEGSWLHGPQLVLGYAVPSGIGRLGVRAEGFLAFPARVAGEPIDADVSTAALRVLAALEPRRASALGFEVGVGLSAHLTTIEAASVPSGTERLDERSSMGWALRVYGGANLHAGRALFALGVACELDPVRVQYGVQHPDAFVTSHSPARVRPSVLASVGVGF